MYIWGGKILSENIDFDYSGESDIHSNPPGQQTAYITIVRNDGAYVKTYSWGCDSLNIYGYGLTSVQDINVDLQGRVYVYGWNYGDTDFDPSSGIYTQKGYYNYASYISVFYPYISNDISVKPGTFGIAGESYSSDSSLLSLTSSSGSLSPTFSSTTYSYNISLGANVESIAFTPTRNEANSRLTINDEVVFSGVQSKAMMVRPGSNTFTIKVTAMDQTSTSTYTITVNREEPLGDYYSYSSTKGIGNSGRLVEHNQSLIDTNGNFYILGSYSGGSVDFGVSGDSDVSSSGQFLLKLDSNQNPLWVKRWVTSYDPELKDMDLDSSGNVYLVGEFSSTGADFDPSENVVNPSIAGGSVLIKIEANGNFSFAKSWNSYYCSSVAVDSTRSSVYVGGYYYDDTDFDPESSENNFLNPNGDDYPFISKFNLSGAYSWTKTFTSESSGDYGDLEQMAVDSLGNIYVAGEFEATEMDFNPDPVATDLKTSYDATTTSGIFLTKINVDGSYGWTKVSISDSYIGLDDKNSLLATDSENNVVLSGYFDGDTYTNTYLNPDDLSQKFMSTLSSQDPFVQKYANDGTVLWVKTFGGTDTESSMVVEIGPSDTVFVGGWYQNYGTKTTDFYPGILEDTYQGDGMSGFLVSLNKDGLYLGTSALISTGSNQINSIGFNGNDMYLGGSYSGTVDMDSSNEVADSESAIGSGDIFLAKFTGSEEVIPSPTPTATTTPTATPTSNVGENSSSSNNSSTTNGEPIYTCSDVKPASAPDLFQIDVSSKTAKLFFTPISNTNQYVISFSTKPISEEHGATVSLAREGVQNFTVNFLKANTVYYFKVRGQNGCATGEWSKVMKVTTRPMGNIYTKSFYKYFGDKINFADTKVVMGKNSLSTTEEKVLPTVTPEIVPSISQRNEESVTPVVTPSPKPNKKRCFLWWCF